MGWTYCLFLPWTFGLVWILVPAKCSPDLIIVWGSEENEKCMEPSYFKCHNGRCISSAFQCDNDNDCGDFSDEKDCSHETYTTICNGGFFCEANRRCLSKYYRCDGEIDCLGGADEQNCYGEGLLFYSTVTEIRGFNIKTDSYFPVATDLTQAVGVSYDGDYVYWTNIFEGQEAIVRSLKNGSDKSIIINSGLGTPEDLAVDLVTNNIYFTDSEMQHIAVCTNDGSACAVLHNKDIDKPRAICLQPDEGLMYWSDWGERPLIARSSMDGNDKADFVTIGIHWPNGITIDHGNGRLYWVDAKLRHIESIKLDGSDRRVVIADTISHPFSIAVFEDSLYWSDYEGMQIQSCNKLTGKNKQSIIQETKNSIFGIHIYHQPMRESLKIKIKNPCEDSGCSDICLLASLSKPLRYTCACPEGKTLASNGHYCRKGKNAGFDQTQILVERNLEWKKGMLGKKTIDKMELSGVEKIGALAYDSSTGNVIISDSVAKKMLSVDFYNGKTTTLLSRDLGKVESLDVDPLAHNLYWVDSERFTVEVMSLKSLERTILMRDLGAEVPVDIVLAPHQGYMFISFSGPRGTHVDRFYMDGLSRRLHFVEDKNIDLN